MRVLCAVAVAVLLSAPAYAQMPNVNLMPPFIRTGGNANASINMFVHE